MGTLRYTVSAKFCQVEAVYGLKTTRYSQNKGRTNPHTPHCHPHHWKPQQTTPLPAILLEAKWPGHTTKLREKIIAADFLSDLS